MINVFRYLLNEHTQDYIGKQREALGNLADYVDAQEHRLTSKQEIALYRIGRFIDRIENKKPKEKLNYVHRMMRALENISFRTPNIPENTVFLAGLKQAEECFQFKGIGLMIDTFLGGNN